ncbi:hypothetical protein D3C74_470440 [compost metagenome]
MHLVGTDKTSLIPIIFLCSKRKLLRADVGTSMFSFFILILSNKLNESMFTIELFTLTFQI